MKQFIGLGTESPEEILELLRANADSVEKQSYTRYFTPAETLEKHEEFVVRSMDLRRLTGELDDVKKEFKAKIDPVKLDVNTLLTQLNDNGEQIVKGEVFVIVDPELKEVGTYGPDGHLITSRPLKSNELAAQTGIMSMHPKRNLLIDEKKEDKKTGTDNFKFPGSDEVDDKPF